MSCFATPSPGAGSVIALSDVVVGDSAPASSARAAGRGLSAELGGALSVHRALVEGAEEFGVFAISPSTSVVLQDVRVRDTQPLAVDDSFGSAIYVAEGASLATALPVPEPFAL